MPPQCLCVPPKAVCGYGSQDALPFRAIKEGELYFQEDREVNLVDLALATNIPKGCAETAVRGEGLPPPHTPQRRQVAGKVLITTVTFSCSPRLLPGWKRQPGTTGSR